MKKKETKAKPSTTKKTVSKPATKKKTTACKPATTAKKSAPATKAAPTTKKQSAAPAKKPSSTAKKPETKRAEGMSVTTYCINKGQSSQFFVLRNSEGDVLQYAPNNWKTSEGALRWAANHGYATPSKAPTANSSVKKMTNPSTQAKNPVKTAVPTKSTPSKAAPAAKPASRSGRKADYMTRHGITIRPATAKDQQYAKTDYQRNANYIISVKGKEYFSTNGSLVDCKTVVQMTKQAGGNNGKK